MRIRHHVRRRPKGKNIPSTTSKSVTFFFIGFDNIGVQKLQCVIDGGPAPTTWEDCATGVSYTNLQAGITHVFQVRAVDSSGNIDQTPETFTWKINPIKLR